MDSTVIDSPPSPARMIHGECMEIMRSLAPHSIDAIVTDPPYAITGDAAIATSRTRRIPPEVQFVEAWIREHLTEWTRILRPAGAVWLTLDWRGCVILDGAAARCGIRRPPKVGVWDKEQIGMGGVLRSSYETFAVVMMDEFTPRTRSERDLWRVPWGGGRKKDTTHPAEKPVALMRRAVDLITEPGAVVLDPFAGSGSTAIACVQSGRKFVGIEREEEYVAIARERIAGAYAPRLDRAPHPE